MGYSPCFLIPFIFLNTAVGALEISKYNIQSNMQLGEACGFDAYIVFPILGIFGCLFTARKLILVGAINSTTNSNDKYDTIHHAHVLWNYHLEIPWTN